MIGAQLMGMVLLVGIGKTFIDQAYAGMSEGINLKELGVLGITAVVLLYLTNKIPPMLPGSLVVRLLVGSVALVPVQLWAQPSPPLVLPQVLPAQVRLWPWAAPLTPRRCRICTQGRFPIRPRGKNTAQEAVAAAKVAALVTLATSADLEGGGGSSFGQAMGTAGRFAADMAGSLASGAKEGLSAKASSMAAATNERVSNTVGGKLASEINGTAGQGSRRPTNHGAGCSNQSATISPGSP